MVARRPRAGLPFVRSGLMTTTLHHLVDYRFPLSAFHHAMTSEESVDWRTRRQGWRTLELHRSVPSERAVCLEVTSSHSWPLLRSHGPSIQRVETWTTTDTGLDQRLRLLLPLPGTLTLTGRFTPARVPGGAETTRGEVTAHITCAIPFIGRRMEQAISAEFRRVAEREQFLIAEWLCEEGLVAAEDPHTLVALGPWT